MNADEMLELKKYKAKIIFNIKPYMFFIVLSIFCFAVSIVFISEFYSPIELKEASSFYKNIAGIEATYGNKGALKEIEIICTDGTRLYVDSPVSTEPLKKELEALTGENVIIFINYKADCVIQVNHNNDIVIDAVTSQNRLLIDSMIFVTIGLCVLVFYVVFAGFSLRKIIQLKREKQEYLKNS